MLDDQVSKLLFKLLDGTGGRVAQQVRLALAHDPLRLDSVDRPRPTDYNSAEEYWVDWQSYSLLAKVQLPSDAEHAAELRDNAVASFYDSEGMCYRTNLRMRLLKQQLEDNYVDEKLGLGIYTVIERWRKEVRCLLGPLPSVLKPSFSSGATLSDKAVRATIPDKLSSNDCSLYRESVDIMNCCLQNTRVAELLRWPETIVRANRFSTVPKDWKKDRAICIEPLWSLAFQLALGKILKRRISRYGRCDFKNLWKEHIRLARDGSIWGHLATLDLSSASDTVSKELVRLILPTDWYELLACLRATHTVIDGKEVYLHKFSSMGNGFTFELETLLFWTLMKAIGADFASVFGDDIIVDTAHARTAIAALRFFGFKINEDKSFVDGPFRESCGGHFWRGQDVSAFNLKELPNAPMDWVVLANKIARYGLKHKLLKAGWCGYRGTWLRAWSHCVGQIPNDRRSRNGQRVFGPPTSADAWIISPQVSTWNVRRNRATQSFEFRGLVPIVKTISVSSFEPDVALASALFGSASKVSRRNPGRLDDVIGYKLKWLTLPSLGRGYVEALEILCSMRLETPGGVSITDGDLTVADQSARRWAKVVSFYPRLSVLDP